jgi:hypothetical protein
MSMPWSTGAARSRASHPAARGPRLQVVPRVQRARGSQFVVLVAGMLVSGLIGLLLLNLSMQKGAFELARLEEQTSALRTGEQSLTFDLDRLESTQHLYRRARTLGMVPNSSPVFLDLTDGSVIGTPVPAAPAPEPTVAVASQDRKVDTDEGEQLGQASEAEDGGLASGLDANEGEGRE